MSTPESPYPQDSTHSQQKQEDSLAFKLETWLETLAKSGLCIAISDKSNAEAIKFNSAALRYFEDSKDLTESSVTIRTLDEIAERQDENIWIWRLQRSIIPSVNLTKREMMIYEQLKMGYSNLEISNHLDIKIRTVEKHVENVLKKLDSDRNQIITS